MKQITVFIMLSLLSISVFAQEGKYVFLKGEYVPFREDGRYKVRGETIFYKNERVYDGPGSNSKYTGYEVKDAGGGSRKGGAAANNESNKPSYEDLSPAQKAALANMPPESRPAYAPALPVSVSVAPGSTPAKPAASAPAAPSAPAVAK